MASQPREYRWWIVATIMLITILEVLDMTIVNVALPHMMGSLGATPNEITWVSSSYTVAAAVCMPFTGLLIKRLGQKRLLTIDIFGFLISSMLCGASTNLTEIVFFRTLQGVFGATLIPIAQFLMLDLFDEEERGQAMAIWGIGVMVAPIFGPMLGGYITDTWGWRWMFYINLPFSIIAALGNYIFVQESKRETVPMNIAAIIWLCLFTGCLQFVLDRGHMLDWFSSPQIIWVSVACASSLLFFVTTNATGPPLIHWVLLRDRNFLIANLLVGIGVAFLFSYLILQPLQLEMLYHYSASQAGWLMIPRGISSALAMIIAGPFIQRLHAKWILMPALICQGIGTYLLSQMTLQANPSESLMFAMILQGVGLGPFFVTLSTKAFASLQPKDIPEATGIYGFCRGVGGSVGIALSVTLYSHLQQTQWHHFTKFFTPFSEHSLSAGEISRLIQQHASLNSYNSVYISLAVGFFILAPFSMLFRQPRKSA